MKALTKTIETINNIALAVVSLPSILEEYREIKREIHYEGMRHSRYSKMVSEIEKRNKRIAELESDNSKLHKECARLQSEVARLYAPTGHGEPAIPELDPGEGFEFCSKEDATEYTCRIRPGYKWCEWCEWCEMSLYHNYNLEYRFRRPIAKPEPKWLACTAEEARANPGESEWRRNNGEWLSMADPPVSNHSRPYRTTATLPLEVAVPKSVWDRAPKEARLFARLYSGAPAYRLMRRHLPDGFRLDAP